MATSRYVVQRTIGSGGMAEVLEALLQGDSGFTRRVAIKRLHRAHSDDPSFVRMFLDEARIASRLHHAGIVGILDYGVVDGVPFQILEFVDGETARDIAKRGMPIEVALYITTEVARALHYAHTSEHSVVHRDVKPSNILVSRAGDVKLADFGIAFATERAERTQVGVTKGTPGYMAPEQVLGGAVDARADIFALGCTLYALALGQTPLAHQRNFERLLTQEPLELSDELPEDVAVIVRRATQPLATKRYATAAEMAEAVGTALASRLRTDAKGAFIKWLDSVAEKPRAAHGTLDALLMPDVFLERDGDAWRMQTTVRDDVGEIAPKPAAKKSPWMRRIVLGATAVAVMVAAAIGFGARRVAPAAPLVVEPQSAPLAVSLPTSAGNREPTATTASVTITVAHPQPRPHSPLTAMPIADVRGTLAVRGGAYRGASVSIDGQVTPYGAPHYFDLPIGKHSVELRLDGGLVASSTMELRADHTPVNPLYWP